MGFVIVPTAEGELVAGQPDRQLGTWYGLDESCSCFSEAKREKKKVSRQTDGPVC